MSLRRQLQSGASSWLIKTAELFFCRANSMETAYKWKLRMNYSHVHDMDMLCRDVYRIAGYLPIGSNDQLRNISYFPITKPSWL